LQKSLRKFQFFCILAILIRPYYRAVRRIIVPDSSEKGRENEESGDFDGSVSVEGLLKNGQTFYGTDQVKIIDRSSGQIAALARCWLRSDCRPPDWCDGLDINGDSVVNFADFAGLNTCCIEAGVQ